MSLKNKNLITLRQLQVSDAFLELFLYEMDLKGFLGPTRSATYLTSPNLLTHHSSPHPLHSNHTSSFSMTPCLLSLLPMKDFLYIISFDQKLFLHFLPPRIYLSTLYQLFTKLHLFIFHFSAQASFLQISHTKSQNLLLPHNIVLFIYRNTFDIYRVGEK